jgi:hypothetical protein
MQYCVFLELLSASLQHLLRHQPAALRLSAIKSLPSGKKIVNATPGKHDLAARHMCMPHYIYVCCHVV